MRHLAVPYIVQRHPCYRAIRALPLLTVLSSARFVGTWPLARTLNLDWADLTVIPE